MRTRNSDKPKPAPPANPTPPARKSAAKNPRKAAEASPLTPKYSGTKRAPSTRGKQLKINDTEASPIVSDINTPQSAVAEDNASTVAIVEVTPERKRGPVKKVTRGKQAKINDTKANPLPDIMPVPADKLTNEAETNPLPDTSTSESVGKLINETEASPVPDTSTPEPSVKLINEMKGSPIPDNTPEQAGKLIEETEAIPLHDSTTEQVGKMTEGTEAIPIPDAMGEPSEAKASADAVGEVAPEKKRVIVKKVTRVVKRKVVRKKTPTSAKGASSDTPNSQDVGIEQVEESPKQTPILSKIALSESPTQDSGAEKVEASLKEAEDAVSEGYAKNDDVFPSNIELHENKKEVEELPAEDVEESILEDRCVQNDDGLVQTELVSDLNFFGVDAVNSTKPEHSIVTYKDMSSDQEDRVVKDVNSLEIQQSIDTTMEEKEEVLEKIENGADKIENSHEFVKIQQKISKELDRDELREEKIIGREDEKNEEHAGLDNIYEDYGNKDIGEENVAECGEAAQREQEQAELTALARERKMKKELEVFVGGLDRGAAEEDVKKVFQHIGEVIEVRVHNDSSNGKNKGYAFVKFATKEQATRALKEMRNPVINGKRCGTAPCEDNDTLFLGNICNTWTKEAIKKKLKDYGVDGVKSITLVSDPQREGLSRGFAFIEFSCHGDAMLAYKRLQKPDVVFGHLERTAKVAFAEPLREPDPEVMMHVKSVFVDGLPSQWNEDHVRDLFKGYGEIERIMLARNMSTSKRKDFGFVDFTTHEAAIACIDDVNSRELSNGNSKVKVRARLSNPLPKTQAIKGEMSGGFRIGSSSSRSLPHIGRGSGRNFQNSRGLYHHGRGQPGRISFPYDRSPEESFRGRQSFGQGGRWGSFRGAHQVFSGGNMPTRYNGDRPRADAIYSGPERHMHFRGQTFPPEEYNRPFTRHYDEPYLYTDRAHGIKRPFFPDQDPNYMEPSRVRPRLDYYGPAAPIPRAQYRGNGTDTFGAGSSVQSHDYYGLDYAGGAYSSFYRGERPYRGGYY